MFKIGCHLSLSGGYYKMGETALSIGANTFQFFTRNPRGGKAKPLDLEDVGKLVKLAEDKGLYSMLAHAPYTMNACAADAGLRKYVQETMADDISRLENIPGSMYNFHPGSHVKQGVDIGIDYIAETLNIILKPEQKTIVLLETMAGKGTEIGRTFEELERIIEKVELKDKLGVCMDTCHINDAGYDVVNGFDDVLDNFDDVIGLDKLRAIHLNDSKNPFSSHKDRHETIGNGYIGIDAIERIINNPRIKDLPFYLETPNDVEGYQKEIEKLKSLRKDS